nr:DUF1003 domain-containing protein [Sphingomicrobium sp. B8]
MAIDLLGKSIESVNDFERRVLDLVHYRKLVSRDPNTLADDEESFGDRMADKVASIGGSWGFIFFFAFVLAAWMTLNSGVPEALGIRFDPYPFIFLNLCLSTLAAVQAPIIMMSQNRSGERDRIAARLDYEVNLRNELEIMRLHEKLDALAEQVAASKR